MRGGGFSGSRPGRKPPPLRAIVLNKTSYTSPSTTMPPNAGVVDLTGISDDEDPLNGTARTRPGGQAPFRRSNVKYVKSAKPKTANNAHSPSPRNSEKNGLSPGAITSQGAKKSRNLTNGNPKPSSNRDSLGTQDLQSRKSREGSGRPSDSMDSTQGNPQKRLFHTVVLSDDGEDELPPLSQFKTPRGLEDLGSQQSTKPALGSPFAGSAIGRKKRRQEEDSPLGETLPSKRQKVRPSSNGPMSISSTDSVTHEAPRKRTDDEANTPKKRPWSKSKDRRTSDSETIDLISPPKNTQKSRAQGRQDHDRDASTQRQKIKSPPPFQATKRTSDRLVTSDPDTLPRSFSDSQRQSPETSPKTGTRSRDFASMTLQGDEAAPTGDSDEEDPLQNESAGWPRLSNRDTTPRLRKETLKGQALSASKKAKSQSQPGTQTPTNKESESHLQTPDDSKLNGSAKQTSQETPEDSGGGRSTAGSEQQPAIQGAPQVAKSMRRASSEDDPGYGSLSSGAGDGHHETETDSLGAGAMNVDSHTNAVRTSPYPNVIPGGGDQDVHLTRGSKSIAKSVASDDNENLPGATAKDSHARPPRSENSLPREGRFHQSTPNISGGTAQSTAAGLQLDAPADKETSKSVAGDVRGVPVSNKPSVQDANVAADEADLQLRSEAMKDMAHDERAVEAQTFALPISAASALKASSMYLNLPLASRVEKVLGKYLEELREDNEYWTSIAMKRARLTKENEESSAPLDATDLQPEEPTSFADLQPIKLLPHQKASGSKSAQICGVQKMGTSTRNPAPKLYSAPYVTFTSDTPDVPNYAHFVSIKNNILAPNVTNLHFWPYFGDDFEMANAHNLAEQYNLDIDAREKKLLLLLQAQKYEDYVDSALHDLGCSWADVLRFLLEFRPDVGSDLDARRALQNRPEFCDQEFSRTAERWQTVLSTLPPSTPEKLARVAVFCDNFQKLAKFSLWHIARRSDLAKLPEQDSPKNKAQASDNELTCRICLRFNCPYHGELSERPEDESDAESGSALDSAVATDIVHPQKVNYRTRVAFPPPYRDESDSHDDPRVRNDRKDPKFWRSGIFHHMADERGPFYPCHHPGTSCEDANCSCFTSKIPCEKICSCPSDCRRKFQGCSCSTDRFKKGHKGCYEDDRCACFQLGRECDPDLCGACGVCEVVDPVNKYNEDILTGRCRNCSIQRGVPKQTLLGDSGVHGLGLYACEAIREHDFVGEYKGEIITKEEAERRGAVYEHQKLSYLFSLNMTQEIDSTYFGNKVRFINHASGTKANLYPRIIMVNTVHRIALYANYPIKPGQELLFDYGPKFPNEQLGGKKSKKSAPHVRNANLVRNFLDVEESEDEVGNVRAKGVSRPSYARNKVNIKNPRGGARPGAGRKARLDGQNDELSSVANDDTRDAGQRLNAFNISDETRSDMMELDVDDDIEDEPFEPEAFESDDSEGSVEEERSDLADEDEDEELEPARSRRNRFGVSTRRKRR